MSFLGLLPLLILMSMIIAALETALEGAAPEVVDTPTPAPESAPKEEAEKSHDRVATGATTPAPKAPGQSASGS